MFMPVLLLILVKNLLQNLELLPARFVKRMLPQTVTHDTILNLRSWII